MKKNEHFYSHIISIDSLTARLDLLFLKDHEKEELVLIIHSHIHNAILDLILTELREDEKKIFLTHVIDNDHEKIWQLLYKRITNVESKILHIAEMVKKELAEDLDEADADTHIA